MDELTVAEAMPILGVSKPTLVRYCAQELLKARKVPAKNTKGFKWLICRRDLMRLAQERDKTGDTKKNKKQKKVDRENKLQEMQQDHDKETLSKYERNIERLDVALENGRIPRVEAERILKIEQALEKKIKNQKELEELVNPKDLMEDFDVVLGVLIEEIREELDKWEYDFGLSNALVNKMHKRINDLFLSAEQKIKAKHDEVEAQPQEISEKN